MCTGAQVTQHYMCNLVQHVHAALAMYPYALWIAATTRGAVLYSDIEINHHSWDQLLEFN